MERASTETDVLIVGGGPGGLSAAIWCRDLGLNYVLLERQDVLGGQLHWIYNPIDNYPGIFAESGAEMARLFVETAERKGLNAISEAPIAAVDTVERAIMLADSRIYRFKYVIYAAGVSRRKLGIPGEDEFLGKGVLRSGAAIQTEVAGRRIAIVGGGDAAVENAILLAKGKADVTLIHRREELTARPDLVNEAKFLRNVEFVTNAKVTAILGDDRVKGVCILSPADPVGQVCEVDHVLIRIGVRPNSGLLDGAVEMDAQGYISVDRNARTSCRHIFAIGDVANPVSPTIATAVGSAAAAAKSILADLKQQRSF
jgi:thioredoxin reductase (NADPH)